MSEAEERPNEAAGSSAPEVQETPGAVESTEAKPTEKEQDWLPKRLEQAKSSAISELLKSAGFGSVDEIAAAREELQKLKDSQLSEQERAQKERDELKLKADRAALLEQSVATYAQREMSTLTEAQLAAVKDIAGDDPSRILTTIEKLKPTWAQPKVETTPEIEKPVAQSTAQKSGPPDTGHQSPVDHAAEYRRIKEQNPFAAAQYLAAHRAEIYAQ